MAYAAVVTITGQSPTNGLPTYLIRVEETGGTTTGEWDTTGSTSGVTVSGGRPPWGRVVTIVSRKVTISAGTAVTVAPVFGRATGALAAGAANRLDGFSAAAYVDDVAKIVRALGESRDIYGRSNPDTSHATNSIVTELVLVDGVV